MRKISFLCFVSLAALCAAAGFARAAINAPLVATPRRMTSRPQDEKKFPQKAEPASEGRGNEFPKSAPVRGREHEKAAKAAYELGVKYGRAGRYEEAVGAFEDAVLYNPRHADAQFGLGHALYDLGRWPAAAEAFKRAAALNPKDSEAFNYLGAAYFRQGLYDKAVEAYKEALILNPDWTEVRYNVANAFYKAGRYEPAIRYYKDVALYKPKSAGLFNDMGVAYAEWGRYDEAAEAFTRATRQDSDDAYAHNNLALTHYLQGRYQEASKALERASRLAPYNAAIRRNAGVVSRGAGPGAGVTGERVSLPGGPTRPGDRRDVSWMGRSDVVRGIEESAAPARAEAGAGADADARPSPQPARGALRADAAPAASPTPAAARVVSPGGSAGAAGEGMGAAPHVSGVPVAEAGGAAAAADRPTEVYRVGVGDILDIRLLGGGGNMTLHTVGAGGLVDFAPLGEPFAAAGKTTEEIANYIKSELKRRAVAEDAAVVVGVREYASHTVIVSGLVRDPGAKVLRREAVPLYVVMADAQPLPEAGQVLITSDAGGRKVEVALDDEAANNILVRPGDVINVLGKPQRFYYIAGKVQAPGRVEFHTGITLTQAILAAGGALHTSKTALVTRQGKDGLLSGSEYDLREIMAGRAPDPALLPGDRVEVIR